MHADKTGGAPYCLFYNWIDLPRRDEFCQHYNYKVAGPCGAGAGAAPSSSFIKLSYVSSNYPEFISLIIKKQDGVEGGGR